MKTANGTLQQGGHFAQFSIPLDQLRLPDTPILVYVLVVRFENKWNDFIVLRRSTLSQLNAENEVGSVSTRDGKEFLNLRLAFTQQDVFNKGVSFQRFRNAFEPWPPAAEG